jgi:predicted 3-demethylubiquinone-9 3-methyltransferase (glyoxalase superfamily)
MRHAHQEVLAVQKIVTSLWFDDQAEEAAEFYTSLFDDSRVVSVSRFGEGGPRPAGTAIAVDFELAGQSFNALNGGPEFKFTEATSLIVNCEGQAEVDRLWDALIANGGEPSQCAWLKDRFGLSWQIVPSRLPELLSDPDPGRSQRAMQAMLKMQKIDIAELERAADNA